VAVASAMNVVVARMEHLVAGGPALCASTTSVNSNSPGAVP
jgi:hypothetical protein